MTHVVLSAIAAVSIIATSSAQVTEVVSPYLTRTDPQDWILKSSITLTPNLNGLVQDGSLSKNETYTIEQGTIFYPLAMRSASHDRDPETVEATLLFDNGRKVPLKQSLVDSVGGGLPLHSGETYGNWVFEDVKIGPVMLFEVSSRLTSWNTRFNEKEAMKIDWPTGSWPEEAASTFEDELFINEGFEGAYETDYITRLAEKIVKGKAKSQPPMVSAKWIAGEVAKMYQPNGRSMITDTRPATAAQPGMAIGAFSAFNVLGAELAAKERNGSPADMSLLLTALYREVGLPARLVVGYVAGGNGGDEDAFRSNAKPEIGLYTWVEVALYDETQPRPDQQLTWVPVDIQHIRADRVYGRPFDQPWDGFGSVSNLNEIIPIGFHLHPHRMGAVSYGGDWVVGNRGRRNQTGTTRQMEPRPSIWGWNVVPEIPPCFNQSLNFSATTPAKGPNDPVRDPRVRQGR